jgi:hypothetical protein
MNCTIYFYFDSFSNWDQASFNSTKISLANDSFGSPRSFKKEFSIRKKKDWN